MRGGSSLSSRNWVLVVRVLFSSDPQGGVPGARRDDHVLADKGLARHPDAGRSTKRARPCQATMPACSKLSSFC